MSQIHTLIEKINEADAILVGAGSGMSAATGLNIWYEDSDMLNDTLRHYANKYGFRGLFDGFYTHFVSEEEHWGFYLGMLDLMTNIETPKPTYEYLKTLIQQKPYHVVTTNQDILVHRYFPEDKVSEIQGSWHYFQSKNTHVDQTLYDTKVFLDNLLPKLENHTLPSELIPKSKINGSSLIPWVRGPEFLEGEQYFEEHQKISTFLNQHRGKKILFLELGVGRMTPMFIQEPFWELTHYLPNSFYVNINPQHALTHPQIQERSLLIHEDIHEVLASAIRELEVKP
ncbi:Sir2 silent information regulator family NAD-dependent deacetylase [Staphylococcus muscae]|uniref:NAD-dependent protein deacetylase, SIR2 family n=1 Tax=Staphylococcus muscae TaxID=1294 RepID=A0A240C7C0_9STAP|nr:Sir2 silent information regulator family NAD-dependent deacetylase [Staphylococcus muscae]AVQ33408.1 Sir2 silent information regulator family NAD-dependent deacetylase [Staphylococcus muscae]PNZ04308.1 Sir2 silent information regulator family NAD-dependent deacetylase [Staphylococcus muscae]GGA89919.1 hypothetical protein GCM10007183_12700 [Staphylococcus muscae]SNW03193.1 NAD-dependent protein deacetylase, SIR2 family [Staphylococcus muscae]